MDVSEKIIDWFVLKKNYLRINNKNMILI